MNVSPDGSTVFVSGVAYPHRGRPDYGTIAYAASTGATQWVALYNNGPKRPEDDAYAQGMSPDGSKLFVTGGTGHTSYDWDYATIAYSTT